MPMALKLGKVKIYNEESPSINSQGPLITWYLKFRENIRSAISPTTTRSLVPKLGKVGTH